MVSIFSFAIFLTSAIVTFPSIVLPGVELPFSIFAAFLAAPLTSLNPTIGAGMVVGLVESYLRKPKVTDFERLRDDIASFPMWWKNGVVRVFLIFFFANVGSAVGTYVAGVSIIQQILN